MASTECPRCAALEHEVDTLQRALESRDVIGQAKGLVMAARACGPDEAFDVLVQQSQYENRKVRDVAADLVARPRTPTGAGVYEPVRHQAAVRRFSQCLTASVSTQGRTATVIIAGEGDSSAADSLAGCLDDLLDTHDAVVVDLAGVTFSDSRFVTTVHQAGRRHAPGSLRLRNVPPVFRQVATVFGFDSGGPLG